MDSQLSISCDINGKNHSNIYWEAFSLNENKFLQYRFDEANQFKGNILSVNDTHSTLTIKNGFIENYYGCFNSDKHVIVVLGFYSICERGKELEMLNNFSSHTIQTCVCLYFGLVLWHLTKLLKIK